MRHDRIYRLTALRNELAQMPEDSTESLVYWMAKAIAIIRADWPDHFEDFQKLWLDWQRVAFLDPRFVIEQAILNFLDGVLATTRECQRPRSRAQKGDTSQITREQLTELRQILATRFDASELRTLCFELGEDYENLLSEGKAGKARELVKYLERRNRIPELVEIGKRLRPDIPWPEVATDK